MKEFFASVLGGLIGAVIGMVLSMLLPDWLFAGIGMVCSSVLLIEFGVWVGSMIRERRKERVNHEIQAK